MVPLSSTLIVKLPRGFPLFMGEHSRGSAVIKRVILAPEDVLQINFGWIQDFFRAPTAELLSLSQGLRVAEQLRTPPPASFLSTTSSNPQLARRS